LSARLDLTGEQFGEYVTRAGVSAYEWRVERKAPAQQRKAFWTLTHTPCGGEIDLPHTLVLPVTQGKGSLPPCTGCTPAELLPTVSHGMHLGCGKTHFVGSPCGEALRAHLEDDEPDPYEPKILLQMGQAPEWKPLVDVVREREVLDLDAFADEAPRDLDLDALDDEPMPRVITLDLAAYAECPGACGPDTCGTEGGCPVEPFDTDRTANTWRITDSDAPPATLNREFRDVLLAPMRKAMAEHPRNHQAQAGPSDVGGCKRKLAHQLLYADEFEAAPSGWASMKGTVLHAWYDGLVRQPGWFSDLALPQSVACVAGGTLDLYVAPARTVIDLKFPGTASHKAARAGRLSSGYYVQLMTYGLGLEQLGMAVEKVGLLVVPMCGDNLDDAIYWEWEFDRAVAEAALADAERIVELGRTTDRAEVLASMPTKSDFCSSCPAFGRHCAGAAGPVALAAPRVGLELVRP
jgi:hypothetical protein